MESTEVKIINAATVVFTQGGVRGSSLRKVAEMAGVSRQTLYAHFGTKDDLLAAVIRQVVSDMLAQLHHSWQGSETLDQQLEQFFDLAIRKPFDLLQVHPDLKDLLRGVGYKTAQIADHADEEKAAALQQVLARYGQQLASNGISAGQLGGYIVDVSRNLKYSCANREDLDQNLDLLKKSVLALVLGRAQGAPDSAP